MTELKHIAIIMDGNGRWAQKRLRPRSAGHLAGTKNIMKVVEAAAKAGVKYLTVYAFSTENWKRPQKEVEYLMGLLPKFCDKYLPEMLEKGIRLRCIGRMDGLPEAARLPLKKALDATEHCDRFTFCVALNYGGRAEIVDAVNKILADRSLAGKSITEDDFAKYLYAPDMPEPDLLIRTGGEKRLSNFLLWEISYSELYVTDVLWPDFGKKELQEAIDAFSKRQRRFGEVK
ncbi:MAG: isoprenyl transferase [Victivallales bacterium]|nr:isoprenyl transferase [Victivallales bacterium]